MLAEGSLTQSQAQDPLKAWSENKPHALSMIVGRGKEE
jgi:hypothetical protein